MNRKTGWAAAGLLLIAALAAAGIAIGRTRNRLQIEFDIHINRETIYHSTYAEPPQFAIWLEHPESGALKQVFVTYRAGLSDWEGKADVPVAIPHWSAVFREKQAEREACDGVSGATPKEDYFRVRVEVPPGSAWVCWIEMNLAGDYNEHYPRFNPLTFEEDEFSCGQPALLYRAEIRAEKGNSCVPEIAAASLWEDGAGRLIPPDSTITTARQVFDEISIRVITPKPALIDRNSIDGQDVLK